MQETMEAMSDSAIGKFFAQMGCDEVKATIVSMGPNRLKAFLRSLSPDEIEDMLPGVSPGDLPDSDALEGMIKQGKPGPRGSDSTAVAGGNGRNLFAMEYEYSGVLDWFSGWRNLFALEYEYSARRNLFALEYEYEYEYADFFSAGWRKLFGDVVPVGPGTTPTASGGKTGTRPHHGSGNTGSGHGHGSGSTGAQTNTEGGSHWADVRPDVIEDYIGMLDDADLKTFVTDLPCDEMQETMEAMSDSAIGKFFSQMGCDEVKATIVSMGPNRLKAFLRSLSPDEIDDMLPGVSPGDLPDSDALEGMIKQGKPGLRGSTAVAGGNGRNLFAPLEYEYSAGDWTRSWFHQRNL